MKRGDGVAVADHGGTGPTLWDHFALPLLAQIERCVQAGERPLFALQAPVGAGKSTLARRLAEAAAGRNLVLAVASIDDFYLPWRQRRQAMAGNPFAVSRVPPGSHDPQLLTAVVDAWRAGAPLRLPRFDKTRHGGEGDRCGEQVLQADALLLEGWLLGYRPLGDRLGAALAALEQQGCWPAPPLTAQERDWLPRWDRALEAYLPAWDRCDQLWRLQPREWWLPRRWRFQAEARQRRQGGGALDPTALNRLVRASLCSLPVPLYGDTPVGCSLDGSPASARVMGHSAVLDGRRRLVLADGAAASAQVGEG